MNTQLLKQIIDKIKEKPEQWDQGSYHKFDCDLELKVKDVPLCNTSHCIAGWAFVLDNINNGRKWYEGNKDFDLDFSEFSVESASYAGGFHRIGEKLLKLNRGQAYYLFSTFRTLSEIEEFLDTNECIKRVEFS